MSPQSRAEKLNAVLFLGLSAVSGAVYYIYQLLAAKLLSPEDFGQFSGWMAWVYLGLAGGAFTQYLGNFFPVQKKGLKVSLGFAYLISFFVVMGFWLSSEFNALKIGWMAILISPFAGWLAGQTQRRLLLITFSFGGFLMAVAKLGIVFLLPYANDLMNISVTRAELFYWSLPLSLVIGIAYFGAILARERKRSPISFAKADSHIRTRILGAVLLSFSSVFIPNIDLVYVNHIQPSSVLTQFAQVSLFYKIVFFVILIIAQWLLPRQLNRTDEQSRSTRRMKLFVRVCSLGLMFSLVASAVAPQFYKIVLGKEFLAPMLWVFMSCFNVSLLTGIFLEVQDQIASLKVADATACLIIQILTVLICALMKLDLVIYLQVQIAVNSMLLFLLFLGAGGIFARQVVDQVGHGGIASATTHK